MHMMLSAFSVIETWDCNAVVVPEGGSGVSLEPPHLSSFLNIL